MRKVKHVYARDDQWVRVHRQPSPAPRSGGGSDWLFTAILWVAGIWFGLYLLAELVKMLMPFLMLGLLGFIFLKFSK